MKMAQQIQTDNINTRDSWVRITMHHSCSTRGKVTRLGFREYKKNETSNKMLARSLLT